MHNGAGQAQKHFALQPSAIHYVQDFSLPNTTKLYNSFMEIHWIQNEILHRLNESKGLRFSELQLENISNPQFNHHLKQLISNEFVQKTGELYDITNTGIITLSKTDGGGTSIKQPKISVLLVVSDKNQNHWVVQRDVRPFKDIYMFPTTKVTSGNSAEETAKKYVKEQLNLELDLTYSGLFRRVFRPDNETFDDRIFLVFRGGTNDDRDEFIDTNSIDEQKLSSNLKIIRDQLEKEGIIEVIDPEPGFDNRY